MSNAIEMRNVNYRAGKSFEIRDMSLTVPTGAMYGFLGPNGSGKTTSIRLMLGMLRAGRGTITVLDHTIPNAAFRALRTVGYVPERDHLYPSLTIDETLRYHASFYPTWSDVWVTELRARFELDVSHRVASLSKGERGKLAILLALGQQPDLLVLDEPTDGLDPVVRRDVLMAILEYMSEHAATVIISSHLVHELERICDWVGVMDGGRLVVETPMQTFKNGMKRLRVQDPPAILADTPFVVLGREADDGSGEVWTVRGWKPSMAQFFAEGETTLREVIDLDLEEGFVELLRNFRTSRS